MCERMFPILDGPPIPWSAIEPYEFQAMKNHGGQSLARLANRGGLGVAEAIYVLSGERPDGTIEALPTRDQIIMLRGMALDVAVIKCAALDELEQKARKYDAINTPELYDFITAAVNEALHQRERWGVEQDGGKTDADWFWLIGYLAGKALHNPPKDDMTSVDARLHRIITVAAAAANWHGAVLGTYPLMRPGIAEPLTEGERLPWPMIVR